MVSDRQVRRLIKLKTRGRSLTNAASMAEMDEKTARKYLRSGKLPSDSRAPHTWRTREDPFAEVWTEVQRFVQNDSRLQAKTLFAWLQRRYPGRFSDGQLRTLQRRLKSWRATEGPAKEIYFNQIHRPGELSQSDFTHMDDLGVTICGELFRHLLYHFVLTYSNWETCTICFCESFESLQTGFENALWKLGGAPRKHRTDRLSAAVNNLNNLEQFTRSWQAVLDHYGMQGLKIQTGQPNENGDVEQSHYRLKTAVDQELILRGSRDFATRDEYEQFLQALIKQRNAGRQKKLLEELMVMHLLPKRRLNSVKQIRVRVRQTGTIRVLNNTYSVDSRLRDEWVDIFIYADTLEIYYGQCKIDCLPRLRGRDQSHIQYRHIIDSLVRKPGAFEHYCYRDELFPTHRFRVVYDLLKEQSGYKGVKTYLHLLQLAARENETAVDSVLAAKLDNNEPIVLEEIAGIVKDAVNTSPRQISVHVDAVNLKAYDTLLEEVAGQ